MKPIEWTTSRLALETGIDRRTVNERLADVKPIRTTKNRRGQVTAYYRGRDAFPALFAGQAHAAAGKPIEADAGERLKQLKVDELELDLAERRGELGQFSSMQAAADAVLVECASRLNAVPQAVADSVMTAAAKGDRDAVVRIIGDGINGAREVIADLRIPILGADRRRALDGEDQAGAASSNGRGLGGSESHSLA